LAGHTVSLSPTARRNEGPLATKKPPATRAKKSPGSPKAAAPKARAKNDDSDEDSVEVAGEVVEEDPLEKDFEPSDGELEDVTISDVKPRRSKRQEKGLAVSKKAGLVRLDPLEAYMREIQAHSLLTPEEEKELAVLYTETGDVNAAARLVTANLRLVVKIAYEYRRAYRNMMDLIQEGNMGLMQAVKKYDPYRGVKLSSYAAWWIRAYMLRFILSNWRMVKLGTTQAQRKLFFNLNKERARLTAMGVEPTNERVAESLMVTASEVEEMDKRLSRGDASLDTPVAENDGRQIARVEMMPAPGTTPDRMNEGAELSFLVRKYLDEFRTTLKGKDVVIFDERVAAEDPKTLQELGDSFGVSRERVRQLEARLTDKLRTFLSERLGDAVEVG
jgi:RNA polymerase sigma-32 factor